MNGPYIYWTIAGRRREDCEQRVGDDDDDDDDAVDDERVMNVNDGGRLQHPSQRLSCVRRDSKIKGWRQRTELGVRVTGRLSDRRWQAAKNKIKCCNKSVYSAVPSLLEESVNPQAAKRGNSKCCILVHAESLYGKNRIFYFFTKYDVNFFICFFFIICFAALLAPRLIFSSFSSVTLRKVSLADSSLFLRSTFLAAICMAFAICILLVSSMLWWMILLNSGWRGVMEKMMMIMVYCVCISSKSVAFGAHVWWRIVPSYGAGWFSLIESVHQTVKLSMHLYLFHHQADMRHDDYVLLRS